MTSCSIGIKAFFNGFVLSGNVVVTYPSPTFSPPAKLVCQADPDLSLSSRQIRVMMFWSDSTLGDVVGKNILASSPLPVSLFHPTRLPQRSPTLLRPESLPQPPHSCRALPGRRSYIGPFDLRRKNSIRRGDWAASSQPAGGIPVRGAKSQGEFTAISPLSPPRPRSPCSSPRWGSTRLARAWMPSTKRSVRTPPTSSEGVSNEKTRNTGPTATPRSLVNAKSSILLPRWPTLFFVNPLASSFLNPLLLIEARIQFHGNSERARGVGRLAGRSVRTAPNWFSFLFDSRKTASMLRRIVILLVGPRNCLPNFRFNRCGYKM